jgi:S1-C subfamily serine protease
MKKFLGAVLCAALVALSFGFAGASDAPKTTDNKPAAKAEQKKEAAPNSNDCKKDCCEEKKGAPQVIDAKYKTLPAKDDVAQYLQDISVTIRAGNAEGSGVITNVNGVNYVWTAGHVVAHLRKTRTIIDGSGSPKVVVEFDDAEVVKVLVEDGRAVGQMRFNAEVLRYSDADHGEDLALLRVRKKNLTPNRVHFYLDKKIPSIGTPLFHVGSLLGQDGSNSMTSGIVSQQGRVFNGVIYDQTTCAAFPGSSGGGVYLQDGRYVAMIVRGAGETFNLVVPMRRMQKWATKVGVDFTLDPSVLVPDEDTLKSRPIEDTPKGGSSGSSHSSARAQQFNFLIRDLDAQPLQKSEKKGWTIRIGGE